MLTTASNWIALCAMCAVAMAVGGCSVTESSLHHVGFGFSVSACGDMDRDGTADLLVSSAGPLDGSGRVFIISGRDGKQLLVSGFHGLGATLGAELANTQDLNGDDVPDFIASEPYAKGEAGYGVGAVAAFSGRTGDMLWACEGDAPSGSLGSSLTTIADVDGDGVPDCVSGAPDASGPAGHDCGEVKAISGRTGKVLWEVVGQEPFRDLGAAVCGVGDIDGDGLEDVACGSPRPGWAQGEKRSVIHILSGRSGRRIKDLVLEDRVGGLASSLACADFDGDGSQEIVVGGRPHSDWRRMSRVLVIRVDSGECVGALQNPSNNAGFGLRVLAGPDLDSDGTPDIIITSVQGDAYGGTVEAFSGGTLEILWRYVEDPATGMGESIAVIGDIDGDGTPDVALGEPKVMHFQGTPPPRVVILSGRSGEVVRVFEMP